MRGRLAISGAIAAGLVFVLWRSMDSANVASALTGLRWQWLPVMAVGMVLTAVFRGVRLGALVGERSRIVHVAHIQTVSSLANALLPLRAGELLALVLLRQRTSLRASAALSLVVIDRYLDMAAVLVLVALCVPLLPTVDPWVRHTIVGIAVTLLGVGLTLVVFAGLRSTFMSVAERGLRRLSSRDWQPLLSRLEPFFDGLWRLRNPRLMLQSSALSLLAWGVWTAAAYCGARAVSPSIDVIPVAFSVCMTVFASIVVSVPSGVGVVHAAAVAALLAFGVPQDLALAYAIVYHAMAVAVYFAAGAISAYAIRVRPTDLKVFTRRTDAREGGDAI